MKALSRIVLAALFLAVSAAGHAQVGDDDAEYEGIPSYSVSRLKVFEGSVWVRTPDSGEWEEYQNNSPVPERARISVPDGSEGEIQFHGGQFMLLTGGSEIDLRRLDDGISVFRLRSGEIRFDLPEEDFSPVRVLVPEGARIDFPVPGKYWVNAPDDEDSRLVVRAGEGEVATDGGKYTVKRGEEARIGRDVRIGRFEGGPEEEPRVPQRLSEEETRAGVPPTAAYELREYGEWVNSSEYGVVWRPRVAPGWTPYYYGRWNWISPYGWTWISNEPWGWYPYHYGYWYTDPVFGWVWYPFRSFVSVHFAFGAYRYPHYHRNVHFVPATVRFVRDGGNVRWVPLRPGDRVRRVVFTRADRRLVQWERPLPARTVYVLRKAENRREWRDWNEVRRERSAAVIPRTGIRSDAVRGTKERPAAREISPGKERVRERRETPPERRIERREQPAPKSRRAPEGVNAPPPRTRSGSGAERPDGAVRTERPAPRGNSTRSDSSRAPEGVRAPPPRTRSESGAERPDRAVQTERPAPRSDAPRSDSRGGEGARERFDFRPEGSERGGGGGVRR